MYAAALAYGRNPCPTRTSNRIIPPSDKAPCYAIVDSSLLKMTLRNVQLEVSEQLPQG